MATAPITAITLVEKQFVEKPKQFDGLESNWTQWVFKFESFGALCGWTAIMEASKQEVRPIALAIIGPEALAVAHNL